MKCQQNGLAYRIIFPFDSQGVFEFFLMCLESVAAVYMLMF